MSTPAVHDGVLYFCDLAGVLQALDPNTGNMVNADFLGYKIAGALDVPGQRVDLRAGRALAAHRPEPVLAARDDRRDG